MPKVKKPRDFKMPESKVIVASAKTDLDLRYIQLYTSGTSEPKTAKQLAAWLTNAAKWVAQRRKN